jgi:glutathione S-transferase
MILIGQYDSPFVRRVGIALRLYGLAFEHRPWSSFGEADKIRAYNPLTRVPTLVLDDGDVLIDSHLILDHLDHLAPEGQALFPRTEPARRKALKVAGLATGAADKAVSLFYEMRLHDNAGRRLMVRRDHGPRRHRRGGGVALHCGCASGAGGCGALSSAFSAFHQDGGAAGLPGDPAGFHPANMKKPSP